jgi:hypothetical protein
MRRFVALVLAVLTVAGATAGCAKAKGSKEAFCKQLRQTPALSTALAGYPSGDSATYTTQLREARDAFGDLQKAAPRSIRADVGAVGELVDDIVGAIEDHPDDAAAVASQLRMNMLTSPSAAKSALNVSNYASKECGLSLNPAAAVPPDSFDMPTSSVPPPTAPATTTDGG